MPTEGDDTLIGTSGTDVIAGLGGEDTINGAAGIDSLKGDDGDDSLSGGVGDDYLYGGADDDTLDGGDGNDVLYGAGGANVFRGGDGFDFVWYTSSDYAPPEGLFVDLLNQVANAGEAAGDVFEGIEGIGVTDLDDQLYGDGADNSFNAGRGNDLVQGRAGGDGVVGGDGDDTLLGGTGDDGILGGAGSDSLDGGRGDDRLSSLAGADMLFGGGGDDVLQDGWDSVGDTLEGGRGRDLVSYNESNPVAGVRVDLRSQERNTGAAAGDVYRSIEDLTGTIRGDELFGGVHANQLSGGLGRDRLVGRGGADTLTGGGGLDRFIYYELTDSHPDAPDVIMDFRRDRIDLSRIDAVIGGVDDPFTIVEAFSSQAGQLVIGADGHLAADVDGDGNADFAIVVMLFRIDPLGAADFVL